MSDTSPHVEPNPDAMPTGAEVRALTVQTREMNETLLVIMDKVDAATVQLGPMLDSLAGHPLFKMFGGKKP